MIQTTVKHIQTVKNIQLKKGANDGIAVAVKQYIKHKIPETFPSENGANEMHIPRTQNSTFGPYTRAEVTWT